MRFLNFTFVNKGLVDQKQSSEIIFNQLKTMDRFLDFGKNKVVIVSASIERERDYTYHQNVLINNETTFEDYYKQIENHINSANKLGYKIEIINRFSVKVWNMDSQLNINIKFLQFPVQEID